MKIIDRPLLAVFRASQRCEWCRRPTPEGCHPHHVTTRGMGGARRLDIRINLIALCWKCHANFHNGFVDSAELIKIVALREKTTPQEIQEAIWKLRRYPRP